MQSELNSMQRANAAALDREIDWCCQVMDVRFKHYFAAVGEVPVPLDVRSMAPPSLDDGTSDYARLVREFDMDFDARMVTTMALIPHLRPQALDLFFTQNTASGRAFTEFGGWRGKVHGGFLPTCESVAFVLAGTDLARRLEVARLFDESSTLRTSGLLRIEHGAVGEPFLASSLGIGPEYLSRLTTGNCQKPDYSSEFPAKLITSKLTWNDLVLAPEVMDEIENLTTWLQHSANILARWNLTNTVKPGYRSLFYGPPGTGKTLTATLIGASVGADVYRIDLSMVVSKYIGETEKNLANVFDQAQSKNWILFFDEADALFGKRTQGNSSNDRHANQEIAYLLQRVEDFPGVVILASNLKSNIDEAFARRFQTAVYFPLPDAAQRLRLWQGLLPQRDMLAADVKLDELADKYELSGGALTNVIRYAAIRATRMKREQIALADLTKGIARELLKEGRTV